jgi:uncharacterized protein (TIGR03083 family)
VPQAEHLRLYLDPGGCLAAFAAHRRRFATLVGTLDGQALAAPSRCSEWTVADVLRHCNDVTEWRHKLWVGESPFESFHPATTPAEWVARSRQVPDVEVRNRFEVASAEMAAEVEDAPPPQWGQPAISPAGRLPWWMSVMHLFFDSWVHERDVMVPLGLELPEEPREIEAVLGWVLALSGIFMPPTEAVVAGMQLSVRGRRDVTVTPDRIPDREQAESDTPVVVVDGPRPELIDALSGRGSLRDVATGSAETIGALGRLAEYLEAPPT